MTTVRIEAWEKRQMRSPKFRAAAREQEPAYQIARSRILRGLTQSQLLDSLARDSRALPDPRTARPIRTFRSCVN